jgi:hypothetical protein
MRCRHAASPVRRFKGNPLTIDASGWSSESVSFILRSTARARSTDSTPRARRPHAAHQNIQLFHEWLETSDPKDAKRSWTNWAVLSKFDA